MAASSLKTGDIIGNRYRLLQPIADGGMARIFKAVDLNTNRTCALKVLFNHLTTHEVTRQRFLSEARLQQRLSHPNIVQVFHVYEAPHLCFAMEFIDGPTLDEVLTTQGALPYQLINTIMVPALRAVSYAHTMGIIHRDLKPSNILLDFDPETDTYITKVMDFGVARNVREVTKLTAAGTTVGTLHYMSPEQIRGDVDLDERADVYSIGVTLYKLVAGRVPFNATNEFALMMAQVEKKPIPPSEFRPDIPKALENVILKAMDKDRNKRFVSVSQLLDAFSRVFNSTHKVSLREMKGAYSLAEITNKFSRQEVALFSNYISRQPKPLAVTEKEYELLNPFGHGEEVSDSGNHQEIGGFPAIEDDMSEMITDEVENVIRHSHPPRRRPPQKGKPPVSQSNGPVAAVDPLSDPSSPSAAAPISLNPPTAAPSPTPAPVSSPSPAPAIEAPTPLVSSPAAAAPAAAVSPGGAIPLNRLTHSGPPSKRRPSGLGLGNHEPPHPEPVAEPEPEEKEEEKEEVAGPAPRILPLRPPKSKTRRPPHLGGGGAGLTVSASDVTLLHQKNDPFEKITNLLKTVEPDKIGPLTSSAVLFIQDQQPIEKPEPKNAPPKKRTVLHTGSGELFTIREEGVSEKTGRLMPLPMPSNDPPAKRPHAKTGMAAMPIHNAPPKRRETQQQSGFVPEADVIPDFSDFSGFQPLDDRDYTPIIIACVVGALVLGFFILVRL